MFLRAVLSEFRRTGLEEATLGEIYTQLQALHRTEGQIYTLRTVNFSNGTIFFCVTYCIITWAGLLESCPVQSPLRGVYCTPRQGPLIARQCCSVNFPPCITPMVNHVHAYSPYHACAYLLRPRFYFVKKSEIVPNTKIHLHSPSESITDSPRCGEKTTPGQHSGIAMHGGAPSPSTQRVGPVV